MWLQIVLDLLSTLFVLFFFWKYQVITFPDKGETTESGEPDKSRKITKKNGIIAIFVLILSCLFYGFFMKQEPEWIALLRVALMYAITFAAAGIDHVSQKIPNSLIGIGLIGGTAVLIVQLIENPGNRPEIALGISGRSDRKSDFYVDIGAADKAWNRVWGRKAICRDRISGRTSLCIWNFILCGVICSRVRRGAVVAEKSEKAAQNGLRSVYFCRNVPGMCICGINMVGCI